MKVPVVTPVLLHIRSYCWWHLLCTCCERGPKRSRWLHAADAMMRKHFEACCGCSRKAKGDRPKLAADAPAKCARGLDKPTFLRVFALAGKALERHGLRSDDGATSKRCFRLPVPIYPSTHPPTARPCIESRNAFVQRNRIFNRRFFSRNELGVIFTQCRGRKTRRLDFETFQDAVVEVLCGVGFECNDVSSFSHQMSALALLGVHALRAGGAFA